MRSAAAADGAHEHRLRRPRPLDDGDAADVEIDFPRLALKLRKPGGRPVEERRAAARGVPRAADDDAARPTVPDRVTHTGTVYALRPRITRQTRKGPCDEMPQGPGWRAARNVRRYCFALNCVSVFFFSFALVNVLSRQSGEPSFLSCTVTG